jgi:hypothetical protein
VGLAVLSLGARGCAEPKEQAARSAPEGGSVHERLLGIAASYGAYHLVDPQARWAPARCASPGPSSPRFSASGDSGTHGRKLYWLFVKTLPPDLGPGVYTQEGKRSPVGQAIVKEAWLPEEVKDDGQAKHLKRAAPGRGREGSWPYARKGARLYHAREKDGLFIMYKVDPRTPGTDNGWVYGTVTADGKRVTSAGRVASCMGCHEKAPHDRLFGLPKE